MAPFKASEIGELEAAYDALEHPGLAVKLAHLVGQPIEGLVRRLPEGAQRALAGGTQRALQTSLGFALRTLEANSRKAPTDWLHKAVVLASGAAGGAAGLPGLVAELPFSLTVMLRSVADHARAEGEDLKEPEGRLECLTVFAYGMPRRSDDALESGYFAVRMALAGAVSEAAEYVSERGIAEALSEKGAPKIVSLLANIGKRLGVALTDKAAVQLVPAIGAAGGAALNLLFMDHYQKTAKAHFTVRRLERGHGVEAVRNTYERIAERSELKLLFEER